MNKIKYWFYNIGQWIKAAAESSKDFDLYYKEECGKKSAIKREL